jgi:hydrogenase nickel incorporation protein HypA/HybF
LIALSGIDLTHIPIFPYLDFYGMHELSIAQSLISSVVQEMEARGLVSIRTVGVKIGALSGVLPAALDFSFEAAKVDTLLESSRLKIEEVAARAACRNCGHEFEIRDWAYICPLCGGIDVEVAGGYELDIAYVEVDDSKAED